MKARLCMMWLAAALAAGIWTGCRGGVESLRNKLFGPSAKQAAEMAFDPNDPDRRREGVAILSSRSYGLREPYLKGYATLLANDHNASVRSAAVRALGKAGDAKYLPDIVVALDDPSPVVRWDAATALDGMTGPGPRGGDAGLAALQKHALTDSSADVRVCCVRALRHYRSAEVPATLKQCLGDEDFSVRYEAHRSLVAMSGADAGYDPDAWSAQPAPATAPAPPKAKRPWWDWMGVTQRGRAAKVEPVAITAPATAPTGGRDGGE